MNDSGKDSFFDRIGKIGTPECAIFAAVLAMALALLLLCTGFWNTVWVALITGAGAFIGGVKDKKQWIKNLLNRVIPDKETVPYREQHPEITRAVRQATEKAAAAPEEAEEQTQETADGETQE